MWQRLGGVWRVGERERWHGMALRLGGCALVLCGWLVLAGLSLAQEQGSAEPPDATSATQAERDSPATDTATPESSSPDSTSPASTAAEPAATDSAESESSEPESTDPALQANQCLQCHGTAELWEGDTQHLYVTAEHLAGDVHARKGITCQQCHGGNADTTNVRLAHAIDDGFRVIETPADEAKFCGHCHADAAYMQRLAPQARTDSVARFMASVHGQHLSAHASDTPVEGQPSRLAACSVCHPTHAIGQSSDLASLTHPNNLSKACVVCHADQQTGLLAGVHVQAAAKLASADAPQQAPNQQGAALQGADAALACVKCHTGSVHDMVPAKSESSPVFLDHQVQVCGECHKTELKQYFDSVHGHGLTKLGLAVTASCADCHGAHGIFKATDSRSLLHLDKVSSTCGKCHRFVAERLEASVHGRGERPARERPVDAALANKPRPSCTSCHQGHDLPYTSSDAFRGQSADRCGNCHQDLIDRYRMSLHGQLAELGYGPAARCSDCHGAHDVQGVDHPDSMVSAANRLATCQKCHERATTKFAAFDPHANHHDRENYPLLHAVYRFMEILVFSVFGFFGVHTLLWLIRGWVHAVRHGRARRIGPDQIAIMRFAAVHRWLHAVVIVSFLGLALTGLPLKFSSQDWAKRLADAMGGFGTTAVLHHICGAITFGYFGFHLIWIIGQALAVRRTGKTWTQILFGPDSPIPNPRDLRDLAGMGRWFVGAGRKPVFERWTYWEKFDYWAVFWGVGIIGTSGLLLWFPEFFCRFLPGQVLNIAKVIHSEEALLATGFIFSIHFFNTHLRGEKFPIDMSMLAGYVTEEEMNEERPEFMDRMRREGKLGMLRRRTPSARTLWIIRICGFTALLIGLGLLAGILVSSF
ncbi:MAG: multiheme c-type cytochrome [Pirellulales bacterium]